MDLLTLELGIMLTLGNIFVGSIILFRLLRNPLKTIAFQWIDEYKQSFLDELAEKPEQMTRILTPGLKALAKSYGVPEPGKEGNINLFGFKIPGKLLEMVMPRLLEKGIDKATENPFR